MIVDYIKGFFQDGLAVTLVAVGFLLAAIWEACVYLWQQSVPEGEKGDEQHASSIEQFPMGYMTFIIALVGVIGCAAIVAWGL